MAIRCIVQGQQILGIVHSQSPHRGMTVHWRAMKKYAGPIVDSMSQNTSVKHSIDLKEYKIT
jgi:hypothetical protein